jgi:hypothetical protein
MDATIRPPEDHSERGEPGARDGNYDEADGGDDDHLATVALRPQCELGLVDDCWSPT